MTTLTPPAKTEEVAVKWSIEIKPSLRDKIIQIKAHEGRTLKKTVEMMAEEFIKNHQPSAA